MRQATFSELEHEAKMRAMRRDDAGGSAPGHRPRAPKAPENACSWSSRA